MELDWLNVILFLMFFIVVVGVGFLKLESFNFFQISVKIFPFENFKIMKIKPYYKLGISKNNYLSYREYTRKQKDQTGETIDYYNTVIIPKSLDRSLYRNGFVLSSGFIFDLSSLFNIFAEMQYNSINGDNYKGGIFLHDGIIVNIF